MALRSVAATLSVSVLALSSTGALANKSVLTLPQLVRGDVPAVAGPNVKDTLTHQFTAFLTPLARGDSVAKVEAYFSGFGFKTSYNAAAHAVTLVGTYAQAQAAGHFTYRIVGTGERAFPLPDKRPSFSPAVASLIDHTTLYVGPKMQPMSRYATPLDAPTTVPNAGFGPPDYAKFYDISSVYAAGIKGQKQTVDIAACGSVFDADIEFFSQYYGLDYQGRNSTKPTVTVINVENATSFYYGLEPTLDVERVHGTAPDASVRLFFVPDCSFGQFEDMFAAIAADQTQNPAVALTISYGQYEGVYNYICNYLAANYPTGVACNYIKNQSAGIASVVATGVTVFASSGDDGGFSPYSSLPPSTTIQADVLYPASDTNVIAVGGTTVLPDGSGGVKEWAWSGNVGSGGGISSVFAIPSYQVAAATAAAAHGSGSSTTMKNVPDVADLADPYTGASVAFCVGRGGCGYPNPIVAIGGTSAASPTFAGFLALIDSARHQNGDAPLANVAKKFFNHQADFRDITVGGNGPFVAGKGYDNVTGIGAPDIAALVKDLK